MCFICCYDNKPAMTGCLGILANLSARLQVSCKVAAMHMSVFTDIVLYYLYCI